MDKFLADGHERATAAIRTGIVAEVDAAFADQLAAADSLWQGLLVRRAIRAEIKRRLTAQAPPDALYFRDPPPTD